MLNYFKSFNPHQTKVVSEATGNWYWLADLLESANLTHILAHSYKTRIIAESKIKTDSISSFTLAQLLRAGLIPQSYLASKKTRSLRELLRYRISLVKVRSSLKCRIHSILDREGIDTPQISELFGRKGNKCLRWALTEASQKAIIKDSYLKAIYDKISYKKGKQKAKVAVANKLAHIIWGVLKYRKPYRPKKRLIMYSCLRQPMILLGQKSPTMCEWEAQGRINRPWP